MRKIYFAAFYAVALGAMFMAPRVALADPAVSAVNGKISGLGGGVGIERDDSALVGIEGSLTVPLGYSLGLQFDGAYADLDGDDFVGAGAHFFWRDPSRGLLGVYAGYSRLDRDGGQDVGRAGVEAQVFSGDFTIDAAIGARFVDLDDVYGRLRLQFYPTDDLMLSAGYVYEGVGMGEVVAQYQIAPGMALFGEGRAGDEDTYSVMGGLRIFFGEDLPLIDRHRRQDPDGYAGYDLLATQQSAERNRSPIPTAGGGEEACPFVPDADLCLRLSACAAKGYTSSDPGPNACNCVPAFDNAPFC